MRYPAGVAAFLVLCLLGSWPAGAAEPRNVEIPWREVPDADHYELELSAVPVMDPLLFKKDVRGSTHALIRLKPGTYYFRVRGIDSAAIPGPWSDVEGFVVNPWPPAQHDPADGSVFGKLFDEREGVELSWAKPDQGGDTLLEVRDAAGVALKRRVDGTAFEWRPPRPGDYRWRVGLEKVGGGEDWEPYRGFRVEPSALAAPAPAASAELAASEVPGGTGAARDMGDRPESWGIFRLAQSVVAYNTEDRDSGVIGSGAALVGVASAEYRWRGGRPAGRSWMLSGSVNIEMIRQVVLDTEFIMPRGYARLFYTRGTHEWRAGPFLQLGYGQGGVFVALDSTNAIRTKVTRPSAGLGGVAVYKASPSLALSALALVRADKGGSSSQLPNPLGTDLGFEAGFGVVASLSERFMLEGRIRGQLEKFSWRPAAGGDSSFVSNTYIIIDVGAGIRL